MRRILHFYKIINNCTPQYLRDKVPAQRLPEDTPTFQCPGRYNATNRFKNSFFPDAIKNWNVIIKHFPTMPTLPVLKAHLNTLFRPKRKSIFNIHDPTGIRCIFQLRVGLSPLRQHKVRHMFADTPTDSCSCGIGTEDTKHFLFSCLLYANQRAILAVTVQTFKLERFSEYLNRCIFMVIIVYQTLIIET